MHGFRRALIIVFEVRVQEMVLIQCNRIIPNAAQQCHANMKYFKKDKKNQIELNYNCKRKFLKNSLVYAKSGFI